MATRRGPVVRFNPLVFAGAALLLVGIAWLAVELGLPRTTDAPDAVTGVLSSAIRLTQSAILFGDRTLDEAQVRFNSVVVAVLLDDMTPEQRKTVTVFGGLLRSLAGDLFSGLGIATLFGLLAGYITVAWVIDSRHPELKASPLDRRGHSDR